MHEEPEGRAMVTVADTGCGMDEETKWRVFEKFYQGDPSHATKGNGLGMALAKRAADVTGATDWSRKRSGLWDNVHNHAACCLSGQNGPMQHSPR